MRLRVMSLNVWALPEPVGTDVAPRMRAIAGALAELGPDVAMLQEVWTEEARQVLLEGAARGGYRHVWSRTGAGGGLVALSRRPFREPAFQPYALTGLPERPHHGDWYGGKGFLRLVVDLDGREVVLFNTHLHARYAPATVIDHYRGHRSAELIEMALAIHRERRPVVAAGDFNFREPSPEYRVFTGLTGMVDTAAERDERQATSTLANPYRRRRGSRSESRIDFVFRRDGDAAGLRTTGVRRVLDQVFDLAGRPVSHSDHAGVEAELELAAPGPRPAPDPEAVALAGELLAEGRATTRRRQLGERAGALAGLAVVGGCWRAGRHPTLTRRRLLRGGLAATAGLATLGSAGLLALSEGFVPDELAAYERVAALLPHFGPEPDDPIPPASHRG